MSQLQVNRINDASGGVLAPISSVMRNRIINGAMTISQRGTSPTIAGGGDYSVDRFFNYYTGNAYTSVQSTVAPSGFTNSLLLTITTASASPTYSFFGHKIEGLNCTDLGFGTATASTVTMSFWVRSSVAGIYSLSLSNNDGNRAYAASYTIDTANTWEQKTVTIPGDTTGTWLRTNGTGLFIRWNMGTSSGSRLISAGSWQAANADGATGSTGANTWANTNGATFYITGVQLEKGTQATGFEYRQYGQELALCQRYYYPLSNSNIGSSIFTGGFYVSSQVEGQVFFPVSMRTAPSLVITTGSGYYRVVSGGGTGSLSSLTLTNAGVTAGLLFSGSASGTQGNFARVDNNNSAASVAFSSEL